MRLLGGSIVCLIQTIVRGFTLYDELESSEIDEGRDSEFLHMFRVFALFFLCAFATYLLISFCCLCAIFGLSGNSARYPSEVRRNVSIFRRVPFGSLLF